MNEEAITSTPSQFAKHRFIILIVGTLGISFVLVAIALWMYAASGTELLDLSRPGYQAVSKSLTQESSDKVNGFDATGPLDSTAVTRFQQLYGNATKKVTSGDPFGGDPLNPDTLGLSVAAQ